MVFLHFPSKQTDEELMLQAKYAKLRKKKKALERMKEPKPEPEKANPLKRQLDPKDAKELAKKLILSGKVSITTKPPIEKTTFKRPRTLERKILATGRSEGHGGVTPGYNANYPIMNESVPFEPFAPPDTPMSGAGGGGRDRVNSPSSKEKPKSLLNKRTFHKFMGESTPSSNEDSAGRGFGGMTPGMGGGSSGRKGSGGNSGGGQQKPKVGPTIYVQVQTQTITEQILRRDFDKFGKIVNVKLNNPAVGFVTFDKVENAEYAVQDMNGTTVEDISYEVQFARRQPNITQLINDASASASWTAQATNHSQKSSFQDKRAPVVYDDPMDG